MASERAGHDRITAELRGNRENGTLKIAGREIRVTNLDRVLYPETGFTKGDLIDYYASVAPVLLPHLKGRPITMRRFPEGVQADGFWEKHCPEYRPAWFRTACVPSESSPRGEVEYCLVNDLPSLIWIANLACVEIHVSLARARTRATPTAMVFDLDPGEPADIMDCAEIALLIRETLERRELNSAAKVSGSKGIQVYVPLNFRARYEKTGEFAHSLARAFEQEMSDRVVSKMKKSLRPGKVLIDWSQNSQHKTTVAVYSMRARSRPSVSMPVPWETLASALDSGDESSLRYSPEAAIKAITSTGDIFKGVLEERQSIRTTAIRT